MSDKLTVEIVLFKLKEGADTDAFVAAAAGLAPFLEAQAGFVRRQLLQGDDGQWSDVVHWRTLTEARQAAEVVMQDPRCHPFMGMIEEDGMIMFHFQQVYGMNL